MDWSELPEARRVEEEKGKFSLADVGQEEVVGQESRGVRRTSANTPRPPENRHL